MEGEQKAGALLGQVREAAGLLEREPEVEDVANLNIVL